jgi:hypothetical protein
LIKRRCFVACISRTQLIVNIQIHLPALLWWATYATAQHRTPIHHTHKINKQKKPVEFVGVTKTQIPPKLRSQLPSYSFTRAHDMVVCCGRIATWATQTNTEEQTTKRIWLKIAQ